MARSIKRITLSFVAILIFTLIVLALRPVPTPTTKNCSTVSGLVENIWEGGGPGDIVITIDEDDNYYYINRGVERGLSANALNETLVNQKIVIAYVNQWTPLDPGRKSRHIANVVWNETTIYTEME